MPDDAEWFDEIDELEVECGSDMDAIECAEDDDRSRAACRGRASVGGGTVQRDFSRNRGRLARICWCSAVAVATVTSHLRREHVSADGHWSGARERTGDGSSAA